MAGHIVPFRSLNYFRAWPGRVMVLLTSMISSRSSKRTGITRMANGVQSVKKDSVEHSSNLIAGSRWDIDSRNGCPICHAIFITLSMSQQMMQQRQSTGLSILSDRSPGLAPRAIAGAKLGKHGDTPSGRSFSKLGMPKLAVLFCYLVVFGMILPILWLMTGMIRLLVRLRLARSSRCFVFLTTTLAFQAGL